MMLYRHLFFILLLCSSCYLHGQEFRLTDLNESLNDPLITQNNTCDLNGEISAILQLTLCEPIRNLSFKGNVIKTEAVNDTLYLVYIPNGTKRITLQHEDYYPYVLNFSENGLVVKGGHFYQAKIDNTKETREIKAQQPKGSQYLTFKSETPIKSLRVNNTEWPLTDGSASRLVAFGHYNYVAESFDGKIVEGSVDVKSKLASKVVNITF